MFQLGARHQAGHGVPVDLDTARRWYERAVEQEHVESAHYLGRMYAEGTGVTADPAKAVALLERAAAKGQTA